MSFLGENIAKLGFGLMRLPGEGEQIDIEQVKTMVDRFLEAGFTYFDTAYVYGNGASERAARDALVKRYPRDRFQLADKMPLFIVKAAEDYPKFFAESLERTGVEYFDFYLLHNMTGDAIKLVEDTDGWGFMRKIKEEGKAKHIGFSYHGTPEALDEVLARHPEVEFVQLQVNYIDWDDPKVRSRECVEVCRKYSKPIVIMEPVKGGLLAGMTDEVRAIFNEADPSASVPSWAVRYCASLDGVVTVLSGMSNIAQVEDNTSYMRNFAPLTQSERGVIDRVVDVMRKIPQIACTACRYCTDGCPQKIDIPAIFRAYNNYTLFANPDAFKRDYERAVSKGGSAADCVACGSCEEHCPQHLPIRELLETVAGKVG